MLCSCSPDISLAANINKAENSDTVRPDQETNLEHPKKHEAERLTIIPGCRPVFQKRVLRKVFGHRADELAGRWRKIHEELHDCTPL